MRTVPNINSGRKLRGLAGAIRELQDQPARTFSKKFRIFAEGPGVVTDRGPVIAPATTGPQYADGQTTPDERHWVQLSYIVGTKKIWDTVKLNPDKISTPNIVYATNLPDLANHSHSLTKGQAVWTWAWLDKSNPPKLHWFVHESRSNAIFRVNLTQTGGSAGTGTTIPSWTYTVKDDAGNTLGTSMSPARGRDYNGKRNAASLGYGHYSATGFVLDEAWESPTTFPCSTS